MSHERLFLSPFTIGEQMSFAYKESKASKASEEQSNQEPKIKEVKTPAKLRTLQRTRFR